MDSPPLVFVVTFLLLWLTARVSARHVRRRKLEEEVHKDFDFIVSATLTLLALLIGFNLVTAVNRYDQHGVRDAKAVGVLLLILPLVVSISFFLIADVDSPRAGVIRVQPENLQSLAESLSSAATTPTSSK